MGSYTKIEYPKGLMELFFSKEKEFSKVAEKIRSELQVRLKIPFESNIYSYKGVLTMTHSGHVTQEWMPMFVCLFNSNVLPKEKETSHIGIEIVLDDWHAGPIEYPEYKIGDKLNAHDKEKYRLVLNIKRFVETGDKTQTMRTEAECGRPADIKFRAMPVNEFASKYMLIEGRNLSITKEKVNQIIQEVINDYIKEFNKILGM